MGFFKNDGARTGLVFGATSGVITTLGLIAVAATGPGDYCITVVGNARHRCAELFSGAGTKSITINDHR